MEGSCVTCGMFRRHIDLPPPQSPRLAALLSSNIAPNDAEIEEFRHMVQESSTFVDSLQDQINKAYDTISTLRAIQRETYKRLNDTKKILHPIRSLPRDILAEIFFACAPVIGEDDRILFNYSSEFDSLCPRNHPWNLSHVCRAWRDTALSLPRLWSTIYLNFRHYDILPHTRYLYTSTLLFARSANLDLAITLVSDDRGIVDHPVTACLTASATRWRTFHCRISMASLESFSGLEFPILQELGVGSCVVAEQDWDDSPVNTFMHASNIRSVTFYDSSSAAESTDMLGLFPWNHVQKLSCHVFGLEAPFRSILEQATTLERLDVSFVDVAYAMDALVLPGLRFLEITRVPGMEEEMIGYEITWLYSLRLPSIERLALTLPNGYPLTLLTHGAPHPDCDRIKHLRIVQNHPSGRSDVLKFLYQMSGVEELQLAGRMMSLQLLRAFGMGNDQILLPSLRVLDLHDCLLEPLKLKDIPTFRAGHLDGNYMGARAVCASLLLHLIESRCAVSTNPQNQRCALVQKVILPEKWCLIAADFPDRWAAVRQFVEVVPSSRRER